MEFKRYSQGDLLTQDNRLDNRVFVPAPEKQPFTNTSEAQLFTTTL
jgi:hypothetical protein